MAESHLFSPRSNADLSAYLRQTWSMRHYAWGLGRSTVRASNAGTSLGSMWLFLEPVFSIAIYWLIFGVLLDVSRGADNYLAFITVGQVCFGLGQRGLLGASASLTAQAPMLRSLAFPRVVLPLSEVLKALAAHRAELVVMLVALVAMGELPRLSWIVLPLIAVVQSATSFGLGMLLARVVWRFSDIQRLVTHLMRLAFYASGVFFPLQQFTDSSLVLRGATLNPFYDAVELARWAAIGLRPAEPTLTMVMAAMWAAVSVVAGGLFFVRAEHTYAARTVRLR